MAVDAPDPRAQALADKIRGIRTQEREAVETILGGIKVKGGKNANPSAVHTPARKARQQVDQDPDEELGDEEEDDDTSLLEEGEDEEDGEDEETSDDEVTEDEPDDDEEEDADDEQDGEGYETLDYSDDDVFEVTVDGEVVEASLRELKKAFSGEGAIAKRLKDATEERKAARAERAQVAQEIADHRANLLRTLQQLDKVLFVPLVTKPDPKLRQTNMNAYLAQKDAFEEDQARIADARGKLTEYFTQEQAKMVTARTEFRNGEQVKLVEKMPELRDATKAKKVYDDIMMAAAHYGFSAQEVAQVDHHGIFLMARDAARWLNMQKLKANGGAPREKLVRKRRLKAGGATAAKVKSVAKQKEKAAAAKRAKTTGRVDDVANMLIANARVKGKPNGSRSRNG